MDNQGASYVWSGRYRADIDGLRAVAVMCVIGFHAFRKNVPGGFIGVDIFFVISGYLISNIIFRGIDEASFSLKAFYVRRIRRIFPALAIVLAFSLVAGWFILFPSAFAQLGLHVAAGAGFFSNILLWTESGYFDSDAATKPLLHLWSLGVEEQYYLVWPLILLLLGNRKWRLAMLLSVGMASFIANVLMVRTRPTADFYLPFTRVWELLIGGLTAHIESCASDWSSRVVRQAQVHLLRNILSLSGLLEIALSVVTLNADQPFPGWHAVLPTFGAMSLIAAGEGAWVNRQILAARGPVLIGLISYPLYLWHWPVLVFQNLNSNEYPTRIDRIGAVATSIALAWLTYTLVELPIRRRMQSAFITRALLIVVGLAGTLGLSIYWDHGLPLRYPVELRATALADQLFNYSAYREHSCFLQSDQYGTDFASDCIQPAGDAARPLLLLWGDSHAASLYPGLRRIIDDNHISFRLGQFTASACPPIFGFVVIKRPHCKSINDFVLAFTKAEKPDTVIMLASWSFYVGGEFDRLDLQEIESTARTLRDLGVRRVIVVGPLPRWMEHQPNVVLREWNREHRLTERTWLNFDDRVLAFDRRIRVIVDPSVATYLSPINTLCDSSGCKVLVSNAGGIFPTAWDDAHLTVEGSEELAGELMKVLSASN